MFLFISKLILKVVIKKGFLLKWDFKKFKMIKYIIVLFIV